MGRINTRAAKLVAIAATAILIAPAAAEAKTITCGGAHDVWSPILRRGEHSSFVRIEPGSIRTDPFRHAPPRGVNGPCYSADQLAEQVLSPYFTYSTGPGQPPYLPNRVLGVRVHYRRLSGPYYDGRWRRQILVTIRDAGRTTTFALDTRYTSSGNPCC